MNNLHKLLAKKYTWYRKWHALPFANAVHILAILSMVAYNIYLANNLRLAIAQWY
jgi:hypothetical protein